MKERFLALAEEVKATGIAEAIYKTSNEEEFKAFCQEFLNENQGLVAKIESWRDEYLETEREPIFAEGEEIQNPMEVVIIIRIMDDREEVSECELCAADNDLPQAIQNIGNDFTAALGELLTDTLISDITAEEIFSESY